MRIRNTFAHHPPYRRNSITRRHKMVFPAAAALIPSNFPVVSAKNQVSQLRNTLLLNVRKQHVSVTCSAKFPGMGNFRDPTKLMDFLNYTKGELWKLVPGSVKDFPWKKAESVALHKSLVLGKETVKWSLLACFALSCVSDILYSITRNKELVIPFGLFVGSLLTKYFDEISQDFMHDHKDEYITWRILGISSLFVVVKFIATYFSGGNDFLLHAANGGLMQVVWIWKNLPKRDGENSLSEDVSTPMSADN